MRTQKIKPSIIRGGLAIFLKPCVSWVQNLQKKRSNRLLKDNANIQHSNAMKICIVRLSALGDVLMTVPLVRRIQDNWPNATISWVISRPAYDLVATMEKINFIVITKPNSIKDYWQFYHKMRPFRYDILLATHSSFRANILFPLIKASRKIGFDSLRAKDGHQWFINEKIQAGKDHTLEAFLKFADSLGLVKTPIRWDLNVDSEDTAWAQQYIPGNQSCLIVNAAASKVERSWSIENYVKVIEHAQSKWNMQVILTGGPGATDAEMAQAVLAKVCCVNLVGKTKPKQLLALIARAQLVICPDTGPSHMACAMRTPVIALHAVTSAQVSGPYCYRHLAVDHYPEAVEKFLGNNSQMVEWGTHVHHPGAMDLIPLAAVIARMDSYLAGL